MTDLEKFCQMLEEFGITYGVHGPKLGIITRVTIWERGSSKSIDVPFDRDGNIKSV